jgi:hypothetical protein
VTHEVQPAERDAVSEKPKRRWYQFSLKTLLVAFSILAVLSALTGYFVQKWNGAEKGAGCRE